MIVPFACCLWMAPLSPEDQKGRRPAYLIRPHRPPPTSNLLNIYKVILTFGCYILDLIFTIIM